jgi:protein-S-isoprenylcysteine O-methyltransferase Ste14
MTTQSESQFESQNAPGGASKPPFLVRRRTVFTWIVPVLLLLAVYTLHPHPRHNFTLWAIGVAFVVLGEIVRFWAAGYISKDAVIATGGPYAFVRNPLYFGSLLLAIGYGLVSGFAWIGVIVLVALYLVFHLAAILYEEGFLKAKFGQPYLDYLARVPRLIPSPWPRTTGEGGFSWAQSLNNREQISALFALIFTALLSLRFLVHGH